MINNLKKILSHSSSDDYILLLYGMFVGIVFCLPFFHGGRLFLLDWSVGPNEPLISPYLLGLDGGMTTGALSVFFISLLNAAFGNVSTWILLLFFFPISSVGVSKLVGGKISSRLVSATLYMLNPFVFSRIFAGHVPLLIGYSLLPFAVFTVIRKSPVIGYQWIKVTLWWTLLTAISVHFFWIFGLVIIISLINDSVKKPKKFTVIFAKYLLMLFFWILTNLYFILAALSSKLPTTAGKISLEIYKTASDPHFGLLLNTLSLYGFWRQGPGPILPKEFIPGWFIIFLVIIVGTVTLNSNRFFVGSSSHNYIEKSISFFKNIIGHFRNTNFVIVLSGFIGFFLALGSSGPFGRLFMLIYDNISFFQVMREPEKFLMLWVLCLSVFFGRALGKLISIIGARFIQILLIDIFCIGLVIAYCPTIFYGLAGQIKTSTLPVSIQSVNKIMGTGEGKVLYLPWHLYLSYPFTANRVVSTLGPSIFDRTVISGDNVEASGVYSQSTFVRSRYLDELIRVGFRNKHFGHDLFPLGVKYIVLQKTVNWKAYNWLRNQNDLKLIFSDTSIEVWSNNSFKYFINGTKRVHKISLTSFHISKGKPSWINTGIPYLEGWSFNGKRVLCSEQGTVKIYADAKGGSLTFLPWRTLRIGYVSSAIFIVALCSMLLVRIRAIRRFR
jgi:hypothetical protein